MLALLSGVVIPGAEYLALEWVLSAFGLTDESTLDNYWHAAEVAMALPVRADVRVWLRIKDGLAWVSTDPGEYRTTPPDEPCVIYDMPEGSPRVRCRHILEQLIEASETTLAANDHEQHLIEMARRLLAGNENGGASVRAAMHSAIDLSQSEFQPVLNDLYEKGLFNFSLRLDEFDYCVILLQLQRILGKKIEQDWTDKTGATLAAFMEIMLADSSSRQNCIDAATAIIKHEMEVGREELRKALDAATMTSMPRSLMLTYSRFHIARSLERCLLKSDVLSGAIGVNPIVLEESQVCTLSGLTQGAHFFLNHPDDIAKSLLVADAEHTLESLRRRSRANANEILPMFTRKFANIVAAQALTLASDPQKILLGIAELNRLGEETSALAGFERGWINQAMLKAYKAVKDDGGAQRTAFKIATQIMFNRSFGEEYRVGKQQSKE